MKYNKLFGGGSTQLPNAEPAQKKKSAAASAWSTMLYYYTIRYGNIRYYTISTELSGRAQKNRLAKPQLPRGPSCVRDRPSTPPTNPSRQNNLDKHTLDNRGPEEFRHIWQSPDTRPLDQSKMLPRLPTTESTSNETLSENSVSERYTLPRLLMATWCPR